MKKLQCTFGISNVITKHIIRSEAPRLVTRYAAEFLKHLSGSLRKPIKSSPWKITPTQADDITRQVPKIEVKVHLA